MKVIYCAPSNTVVDNFVYLYHKKYIAENDVISPSSVILRVGRGGKEIGGFNNVNPDYRKNVERYELERLVKAKVSDFKSKNKELIRDGASQYVQTFSGMDRKQNVLLEDSQLRRRFEIELLNNCRIVYVLMFRDDLLDMYYTCYFL